MIKYIDEIDFGGKRVFIRVDFNVPLKDGVVKDATRIRESLPTIQHAIEKGGKLILASHLGRPKGTVKLELSLVPVAEKLAELIDKDVIVPESIIGDAVDKLALDLREGQVMMLENIRFHPGEEKNDPEFAGKLAKNADVYVNDAFGTAHRAHASTVGMVEFVTECGAGMLMKKDLEALGKILKAPERPFVVILGGAKISDKLGVVKNLVNVADTILIGGGMAYTFLQASGHEIGRSLLDKEHLRNVKRVMEHAEAKGVKLLLPTDHVVASSIDDGKTKALVKDIPSDKAGFDIGPETVAAFQAEIRAAKTIFWNGPMGVFENEAFNSGTFSLANSVADSSATSVVGGGDSVAAINEAGVADKISHISTGGGASLKFLEGKTLPGIKALDR